ncbi:hypothetical protein ACKWTF_011799 [Chironomus riparius]
MNKMNNLFILPPFSNAIYRVQALNQQHELYEKVIEFQTGANNNILDILNLIDCKRYRIKYIVCNREKSFIGFRDGIDAIEGVDILRRHNIFASFANCYAHVDFEGNNSCHPNVALRNLLPPQAQPSHVGVNRSLPVNNFRNDLRNEIRNSSVRNGVRNNARNYLRNGARVDARHYIRNVNYNGQRRNTSAYGEERGFRSRPYRRRNYPQRIQQNTPHAVRVPMPHVNAGQQEFEWILVRK